MKREIQDLPLGGTLCVQNVHLETEDKDKVSISFNPVGSENRIANGSSGKSQQEPTSKGPLFYISHVVTS